ncbi:MAG: hypothetical protein M1115_11965 [Actinobacteria bacterium]|nr:hypothetical protein [Actinomycetota bacterium]
MKELVEDATAGSIDSGADQLKGGVAAAACGGEARTPRLAPASITETTVEMERTRWTMVLNELWDVMVLPYRHDSGNLGPRVGLAENGRSICLIDLPRMDLKT